MWWDFNWKLFFKLSGKAYYGPKTEKYRNRRGGFRYRNPYISRRSSLIFFHYPKRKSIANGHEDVKMRLLTSESAFLSLNCKIEG